MPSLREMSEQRDNLRKFRASLVTLAPSGIRNPGKKVAAFGATGAELEIRAQVKRRKSMITGGFTNPQAIIMEESGWHRTPESPKKRQKFPKRTNSIATKVVRYFASDRLTMPVLHYIENVDNRTLSRADWKEFAGWLRRNRIREGR